MIPPTARVRIFTVAHKLPFAGHPNVGTSFVLAQKGRLQSDVLLFEEKAGLAEVRIERGRDGTVAGTTIGAPQPLWLGDRLAPDPTAVCAELDPAQLVLSSHQPVLASVGTPFVLAEVEAEALSRAIPNPGAFRQAVGQFPALNGRLDLYPYARSRETGTGAPIWARMFSPLVGMWEDPATGSAATPLAALLLSLSGEAQLSA